MSNQTVVVDPVTRIEGHLRIEAETENGKITKALSSGTAVRGLEIILKDRDPRDAWVFAQRICGVCTLVHAMASVRSVEDALRIEIPPNAQLIRNLMIGAQYAIDHVMHFYHLHALDWVDVVSSLDADPAATSQLMQSISDWPLSSPGYFRDVQRKIRDFVESGQLGIFAKGYWGHPAYKLPPEANLMAVAHYLEALEWQREMAKLHAIFGGKNPHPNFLVGGAPVAISVHADAPGAGQTSVNTTGLQKVANIIEQMKAFITQVYIPDTLAIASFYKDWFNVGHGEGTGNFMCFGDFPTSRGSMFDPSSLTIPRGIILNRDLSRIHELDLHDPSQVQEFIPHSWYEYEGGKNVGLHPYDGETKLAYDGPAPGYENLDPGSTYTWLKAPRWKGHVMEVGPLARVLMLYASGHEPTVDLANYALGQLDLPIEAMFSTMGRIAARTLETKIIVDMMDDWFTELNTNINAGDTRTQNSEMWSPGSWPREARGAGYMEAPRGGLGHWIVIKNRKIDNYQCVVPTTWLASPRDHEGKPGVYENALVGHDLHDPAQPLEILRTIHSFDPCLACAVHVADKDGNELVQVKVA